MKPSKQGLCLMGQLQCASPINQNKMKGTGTNLISWHDREGRLFVRSVPSAHTNVSECINIQWFAGRATALRQSALILGSVAGQSATRWLQPEISVESYTNNHVLRFPFFSSRWLRHHNEHIVLQVFSWKPLPKKIKSSTGVKRHINRWKASISTDKKAVKLRKLLNALPFPRPYKPLFYLLVSKVKLLLSQYYGVRERWNSFHVFSHDSGINKYICQKNLLLEWRKWIRDHIANVENMYWLVHIYSQSLCPFSHVSECTHTCTHI